MAGRYKAYDKLSSTREVIIEDFPEHWTLTRIKFNSLVKARVGWHGLKSDDFTEVGPYLVTGSDFKGKFIQWKNCYHCDEERYEQDPYIQLTNGDLLITKDGTIGKVALVSQLDGKATLNSGVFVVRPLRSDYTTQYYYWLLLSRSFTDFVDYYKTGSTIAHLYQETFVNFKYPLPPYEEQQKIASFLDHETAKIDTLIAKQEKLIELLKEKRQAVISHAVTKGLNPNAPMRDSGVEWLGEVPKHWVVAGFKKFIEKIVDYRGKTPNKTDSGVFLVTARNIKKGVVDYSLSNEFISEDDYSETMSRGKPNIGDVLFTTEAPLGEVANVDNTDIALAQRIIKFSGKKDILDNYFFKYFMMSEAFQTSLSLYASGSTVKGIKAERLVYLRKLIPPLAEQKEITHHIDIELKKFDLLVSKAEVGIELIKERKTALISAAVTGKIDLRDWKSQGI